MNTLKRMHACVHTLVMYERQLVATTFPNDLFLRYVEHPVLVHEHVVQRHDQATQQKSRDEDGVYWPDVRELGAEERRQSEELVQHLVVWKDYFCCVVICESSLIASRTSWWEPAQAEGDQNWCVYAGNRIGDNTLCFLWCRCS